MLNVDKFEYYPEHKLPKLVLAIECYPYNFVDDIERYDFTHDREWKLVAHQMAGISCNQKYMYATELTPRNSTVRRNIKKITEHWLNTDVGTFGSNLIEVNEFNDQLSRFFDVQCNISYLDFQEAYYPIDCTHDNIKKMTNAELPKNLNDLIIWQRDHSAIFGSIDRWKLLILGKNGD